MCYKLKTLGPKEDDKFWEVYCDLLKNYRKL